VSRALGLTQTSALVALVKAPDGLTVNDLSAVCDITPRRCRAVVASLDARGMVEALPGWPPRWTLPAVRARRDWDRANPPRTPRACPYCGARWREP